MGSDRTEEINDSVSRYKIVSIYSFETSYSLRDPRGIIWRLINLEFIICAEIQEPLAN